MLYPQLASGDLAYPLKVNFMASFRGAILMAQMEAFNNFMSNVRQLSSGCLETLEYFKFMDFEKT